MAPKLLGKRILLVIAPEQFRDEELLEPKEVFKTAGADVLIAACKQGEATGMLGAKVSPDLLISEVKANDFDACAVIGGMGSLEHLWNDTQLHGILQTLQRQEKVVAAICLSGAVLAKAGVLKGKKATVYAIPESLQALKDGGAEYKNEHVVRDGLIVTADGPAVATKFAQTIVDAIQVVPSPA